MKTKEEILAHITGRHLSQVNEGCFNMAVSESLCAMQEYSDQQTANLKAINSKQAELIENIKTGYPTPLSKTAKRLELELQALQSGIKPTAMEMVRETFEPIQLDGKDRRKQLDELYETYIEELENHTTPHRGMKAMIESVKAEIKQEKEVKSLTKEEAQKCYPDLCFCEHSTYTKGVCDKCGKSCD